MVCIPIHMMFYLCEIRYFTYSLLAKSKRDKYFSTPSGAITTIFAFGSSRAMRLAATIAAPAESPIEHRFHA